MAVTYIDTKRAKDISKNIVDYANEYNVLINKLFKRLTEVPYITREWVGQTSEKYFKYVALEKSDFLDFGDQLKSYGVKISKDVDLIEDRILKNNKEEKKEEV